MKIKSAIFEVSAPTLEACPEGTLPEFAFIGRSNVGKSSLLNLLAGQKGLARVSDTPGHTKLINFFVMNKTWRLVDLPGYGYAAVAKEQQARFNDAVTDYLLNRENLSCIFLLIDSRLAPQAIDLEFVEWLVDNARPFVVVFTKVDQSKSIEAQQNIARFKERLADWCENLPQFFTSSAETRTGAGDLLQVVEQVLRDEED